MEVTSIHKPSIQLLVPENLFSLLPACHSARRASLPGVAKSNSSLSDLIKISYFHPCSFYRRLLWKFSSSVPHHPGSMWNMMMGMWMRVRMVMIVFLMDRFHPRRFLIFLINPPCFPVSRSGIVNIGRIILSVWIVITGWTFGYIFVVLNRYKTFKTPTLLAVIFVKRHCYSFYF